MHALDHSHDVTDPGHSHGIAIYGDPGHSHGVCDPGHCHGTLIMPDMSLMHKRAKAMVASKDIDPERIVKAPTGKSPPVGITTCPMVGKRYNAWMTY
jgi:hypothetical protein